MNPEHWHAEYDDEGNVVQKWYREKPIRLFIGTSSNGEDAEAEMALEYSLRENIQYKDDWDLEIVWIRQTNDESSFWYGFNDINWHTPYEGFKWAIPEYCGFKGRAIYMDVNMVNASDIVNLWIMDSPEHVSVMCKQGGYDRQRHYDVMVFNNWMLDPYNENSFAPMPLSEDWKSVYNHNEQFLALFNSRSSKNTVGTYDPRWNADLATMQAFERTASIEGDEVSYDEAFFNLNYDEIAVRPWKPSWYTGEWEEQHEPRMYEYFKGMVEEAKESGYKLEDYTVDRGVTYRCIGR